MTKPEDMNTINEDGTAYNGNHKPIYLALSLLALAGLIIMCWALSPIAIALLSLL